MAQMHTSRETESYNGNVPHVSEHITTTGCLFYDFLNALRYAWISKDIWYIFPLIAHFFALVSYSQP